MAHSTKIEGFVLIHNGDYSGDVEICEAPATWSNEPITIPFSVLASFVAGYVLGEKIRELENAATLDVLLGKVK